MPGSRSLRAIGGVALAGMLLAASAHAGGYRAPRTSWGAPDLQGAWTNFALTRLERPPGVPARITKGADVAAIEHEIYEHILPNDALGARESEWWQPSHLAVIDGEQRTSWITSTPDGRIPYTDDARKRLDAWRAKALVDYDGPESRNTSERCLTPTFSVLSPPMQNAPYTAGYRIVQTKDTVVIVSEINTAARVVRLGGRHDEPGGRTWGGDSVGHWDKDTLVVDTVGFRPEEAFRAPVFLIGPDAHVTERFTRVSPTEIRYAFTVEDAASYQRAWSGEMAFHPLAEPMYEYACHEGNTSLEGLLKAGRYVEAHPGASAAR
ncbi:MAG: hypothetical protein ACJ798_02970 [Phenylobacterium sp.]